MARLHMSYGSRDSLLDQIGRLAEAGYSGSATKEARQRKQFYFGPDINESSRVPLGGFMLVWESED
jgi:hypothetical protein